MKQAEFERLARKALVLYVSNAGSAYTRTLDDLIQRATNMQWASYLEWQDQADEDCVDAGVGTPYQQENVAVKREAAAEQTTEKG